MSTTAVVVAVLALAPLWLFAGYRIGRRARDRQARLKARLEADTAVPPIAARGRVTHRRRPARLAAFGGFVLWALTLPTRLAAGRLTRTDGR